MEYRSLKDILEYLEKASIEDLRKLIEEKQRSKVPNTFLTFEELVIAHLYYRRKFSPIQIAKVLGKTRSNIYTMIRKIQDVILKSSNTIELYNALTKTLTVHGRSGERVDEVIDRVLAEIGKIDIRARVRRSDILNALLDAGVVSKDGRLTRDVKLFIDLYTGKIHTLY